MRSEPDPARPTPRQGSEAFCDPAAVIDRFAGQHEFLSNFHRAPLEAEGEEYPGAEWAFNALKTLDPDQRRAVRLAPTAAKAKALGRRVTLRVPQAQWDTRVRYEIMDQVLAAKFADPDLRTALLATGDALLVEGTGTNQRAWHDQVWGQCSCDRHRSTPGANALGVALMHRRAVLGGHRSRWTRVAVTGHRPQRLTRAQADFARAELDRLAVKLTQSHHAQVAISGMALGADTWWASSALAAGLDLWAYAPFWDQAASWPSQDAQRWEHLLAQSTRQLVLGETYDVRLLHARNDFMIRDANLLIAVHNPRITTGGTASTVAKARTAGKTIVTVDVDAGRTTIHNPDARRSGAAPERRSMIGAAPTPEREVHHAGP